MTAPRGPLPMSSMYARQLRCVAVSWSATVVTVFGYTHPSALISPDFDGLTGPISLNTEQPARVSLFGGCPPIIAM